MTHRLRCRAAALLFTALCCGIVPPVFGQAKPGIDVCAIIPPAKAKAVLGALAPQPPATTDHVGFGIDSCLYIGPALSGAGAQTVFSRLTVQAGIGKDAPDMLQMDADKRKATIPLTGVGDAAKRNQAGSFVWAKQGGVVCTAEIANGLPNGLTADSAAAALGGLCRDVFAAPGK